MASDRSDLHGNLGSARSFLEDMVRKYSLVIKPLCSGYTSRVHATFRKEIYYMIGISKLSLRIGISKVWDPLRCERKLEIINRNDLGVSSLGKICPTV